MITYAVSMNQAQKVVTVRSPLDALPSDHISIGSYDHDGDTDLLDSTDNHVLFHHVRELLYGLGIFSTQLWTINLNNILFLTFDEGLLEIDGNPVMFN
jgi:hypothetical protein